MAGTGIIQHNIPAMAAYRNYSANTSALAKNLEKLSSGYKINRAGDDAAGLAISEKMRAQIAGLEVASKNAKDGISLVQTAEGALTEVHDMLRRMITLAEQSANGTYDDDTDRVQLQKEMDQLRDEINRIADSANFNGIKLLDGSMDTSSISGVDYTAVSANKLSKMFVYDWDNWNGVTQPDVEVEKNVRETEGGASSRAGFEINLDSVTVTTKDDVSKDNPQQFTLKIGDPDNGGGELKVNLTEANKTYTATDLAKLIADEYKDEGITLKVRDSSTGKEIDATFDIVADGKTLKFTVEEDNDTDFKMYDNASVTWSVSESTPEPLKIEQLTNPTPNIDDSKEFMTYDLKGFNVNKAGTYSFKFAAGTQSNDPEGIYSFDVEIKDSFFTDGKLDLTKVAGALADAMKANEDFAGMFKSIKAEGETVKLTAKDGETISDEWKNYAINVAKKSDGEGDDDGGSEPTYSPASGNVTITWPGADVPGPVLSGVTESEAFASGGSGNNAHQVNLSAITATGLGDIDITINGKTFTITLDEEDFSDEEYTTFTSNNVIAQKLAEAINQAKEAQAENMLPADNDAGAWTAAASAGILTLSTADATSLGDGAPTSWDISIQSVTQVGAGAPTEPTWAATDTITFTWADADGQGNGLTFTGARNSDNDGWVFTVTGDALDALGLTNDDFTISLNNGTLTFEVSPDNMADPSKLVDLDLSGAPVIATTNAGTTAGSITGASDFTESVEEDDTEVTSLHGTLTATYSEGSYVEKGTKQEGKPGSVAFDVNPSVDWDWNYLDLSELEGQTITINLKGSDSITLKLTSDASADTDVDLSSVTSTEELLEAINTTLNAYIVKADDGYNATNKATINSATSGSYNEYADVELAADTDGSLTVSYKYTVKTYESDNNFSGDQQVSATDGTADFDAQLLDAESLAGKTITIQLKDGDDPITLTLKNDSATEADGEVDVSSVTDFDSLINAINSTLTAYISAKNGNFSEINTGTATEGTYNKYSSIVLADDGEGGFTVTYAYTGQEYKQGSWQDDDTGLQNNQTGSAAADSTLFGDKPEIDWDSNAVATDTLPDLTTELPGKSLTITLETGENITVNFVTSASSDPSGIEVVVESGDTADDIIGKINSAIEAKLADINGQLEASAQTGNADFNKYSNVKVAADGNGGLTVTYDVQAMTYEGETEETEQKENSSGNIFGGNLDSLDPIAQSFMQGFDPGDLTTNIGSGLGGNNGVAALDEYFKANKEFEFKLKDDESIKVDLSKALEDLLDKDTVTMKDVYAAIAETVNEAVKSEGLKFWGITTDVDGKNWIYGGPKGVGLSTQDAGDAAYMWLTEDDETEATSYTAFGTIGDGIQNVTDNNSGAAAQLANTKVNFGDKNVNAWQDGARITIGDTTYVVALGKESKFKNVTNVIDLTDFESITSDDEKKTAAQRLTVAAKDNSIFIVSHDGQGNTALKQRSEVKETTDMSTREKVLSYLGVSHADANSITSAKAGSTLTLQIGDTADSYNQLKVSIGDCHTTALGIDGISIADQDSAALAVDKIKAAINTVSDIRGTLGATQNRLEHTINNLSVMTENIQDAESTIRDTDIAAEMMAYTKNNILVQAAQAMLAQANMLPQGVLQLLG